MQVFKFGGASIRDAAGVKQVASIIKSYRKEKILVVVSAMGKTTNAAATQTQYKFIHQDI